MLARAALSHAHNAESQSDATRNKPVCRSSSRRHAASIAQDVATSVRRIKRDTSSRSSDGGTVRHDAKLARAALSHADNAESQSNAAGNNPVMADFVVATVQGPYQYIRHGFPHTAATCCPQQSQDGAMFWRPRTMHIRAMLRPTVGQGAPRGGSNALTDVCVTEGDVRRLGIVSSSTKDAPPAAGNVLQASDSHDNALSNRGGMPPPQ